MVIKISEGAEAFIYGVRILGIDAIVKYRAAKKYRIAEMDRQIRSARTKKEARIMTAALEAGVNVPSVLFVDEYSVCMSRVYGKSVNALMTSKKIGSGMFRKLGVYAGKLHNAGIAHGDYTPANVMVDVKGMPWIIDFGLSEMTSSFEDEALDLLLMKRSINTDQFRAFADGYRKQSRNAAEVMRRLGEIEKRGRYQTRTLLAEDGSTD
jgi:Kae1-associated kinase Bud32